MYDKKPTLTNPQATDTSYLVHAKATYYPEFVRIWIPNEPYEKINSGYERKAKSSKLPELDRCGELLVRYETDNERSVRRTRKRIKDYVIVNDFEFFATFTFGKDRQDEKLLRQRFATWLRNQRVRNGRFLYLAVPEYHKDGVVHFHTLIGGYKGELTPAVNAHTGKLKKDKRGNQTYNIAGYTHGFTDVKVIDGSEGKMRTAYYIQKYITKDANSTDGRQRYWSSKNLKLPKIEENPQEFYKHIAVDRHYMNDYGTILEIDKGTSPLSDMFIEANN